MGVGKGDKLGDEVEVVVVGDAVEKEEGVEWVEDDVEVDDI